MTLVTQVGLRLRVVPDGIKTDEKGWEHLAFTLTLFGPGGEMTFPYRHGVGIEREPDVEDVMASLLMEARVVENKEFDDLECTVAQSLAMIEQTKDLKRVLGDTYEKFLWGEGVKSTWVIKSRDHGSGGFLSPPGSALHRYSVEERDGVTGEAQFIGSLDSVPDYAPEDVKAKAAQILADHPVKVSELWVQYVYGYFKNCYSPDGKDRNVSHCIIVKPDTADEKPPAEHHLAYLHVKEYFPDHTPRLDLIDHPEGLYGSRPCKKCLTSLQYEARVDAFAEAITAKLACPEGGQHEPIEPGTDDPRKLMATYMPTREKVEVLDSTGTPNRWRVKAQGPEHRKPHIFIASSHELKHDCGHLFQNASPMCRRGCKP